MKLDINSSRLEKNGAMIFKLKKKIIKYMISFVSQRN